MVQVAMKHTPIKMPKAYTKISKKQFEITSVDTDNNQVHIQCAANMEQASRFLETNGSRFGSVSSPVSAQSNEVN